MYRRPKFLEILDKIREEMSREADYDVDLFAEMVRNKEGKREKGESQDLLKVKSLMVQEWSKTNK